MNTYKIIDLFSGAGGLSLGFLQTGRVNIVAAAEVNTDARKTYKRNFKVGRVYSDVRTIDYNELTNEVGTIDIVAGGPPCQGFSNANRQHTTIISMNNRLVKEYVRAICEIKPKAFIIENVAMLKSKIHRFMVEEDDLDNKKIMDLNLSDDEIELLPADSVFEGALDFIKGVSGSLETANAWMPDFYKTINILYRYRINQPKFDEALKKHSVKLYPKLQILADDIGPSGLSAIQEYDSKMAKTILDYSEKKVSFQDVISSIQKPILIQRAIMKMLELSENSIHIYGFSDKGRGITASVKSYSVRDYIEAMLSDEYTLYESTLNAIHYGAPQRRERFIIVGIAKHLNVPYSYPLPSIPESEYRSVRDAIADIQDIPAKHENDGKYVILQNHPNAKGLERELRGKLLYNHVTTQTKETAMARFEALKEGQNFHDLNPELKSTYSNVERTQNTIYMRLKYDEPCGTVVSVRKSMWIHPELDRAISIREAARLQTFPDSFIFEGSKDHQYQQIGNAVPPFLAKAIAKSIITVLDKAKVVDEE